VLLATFFAFVSTNYTVVRTFEKSVTFPTCLLGSDLPITVYAEANSTSVACGTLPCTYCSARTVTYCRVEGTNGCLIYDSYQIYDCIDTQCVANLPVETINTGGGNSSIYKLFDGPDCTGQVETMLVSVQADLCIRLSNSLAIRIGCPGFRYGTGFIVENYNTSDCSSTPTSQMEFTNLVVNAAGEVCFNRPGNTTSIYCRDCCTGTCFHEDTLIQYEGEKFYLGNFKESKAASFCAVPHVINADGVSIQTTCHHGKPLRLTKEHLVYTTRGLVMAGRIEVGDFLFADMNQRTICEVTQIQVETNQNYFGLNCEESEVLADGFKTSTFGYIHILPSIWMKLASKVVGIHKASMFGDKIASLAGSLGLLNLW